MVSVIIPTYNYAHFLPEALQSLQSQSHSDFECIIIDNGSKDKTHDVVQPYLSDKRFKYYYQENKGVSSARNLGLSISIGEYILFLDADDKIERQKLQQAVACLASDPGTDLVYSDMRYFRDGSPDKLYFNYRCESSSDTAWMSYFSGKDKELVQTLLGGNIMVISSPVFRKKLIADNGSFDESIRYNEDWDLWLRFAIGGAVFKYLDKADTRALIRVHGGSASVNVFLMQVCGWLVLQKNAKKISDIGLSEKTKNRIRDHKKAVLGTLIDSKDHSELQSRIQVLKDKGLASLLGLPKNSEGPFFKLNLKIKKMLL